ncbi:hypothetical protein AWZ03_015203, partial [Drosophila navojoa]
DRDGQMWTARPECEGVLPTGRREKRPGAPFKGMERRRLDTKDEERIACANGRYGANQAGKTAEAHLLIMPTMLDHVILGMDFLCTIGTTVRSGNAELEMRMVDDVVEGASPSSRQGVGKGSSDFRGQDQLAEGDAKGGPKVGDRGVDS